MKAGDVLILVRRRDPFTTPMIRALKREGVPVAGADRMKLMDQLAVQDLVALADMLLLPGRRSRARRRAEKSSVRSRRRRPV